jgi:hypothetical protein
MLSLLAVFAVGAVASAAASAAAPEFKPVPVKNKFTDKEGVSHLNGPLKITVTCKADTSTGEIAGPKIVSKVGVIFTKCTATQVIKNKEGKEEIVECKAHSPKKEPETIETNTLKGTLGFVTKSPEVVGLSLGPEGKEGFVTIEAECLTVKTTQVSGSVIGEVKPLKVKQLTGKLEFMCNPAGSTKQTIQNLEGVAKDTLSAFGSAACFESEPDTITFEEAIEVT